MIFAAKPRQLTKPNQKSKHMARHILIMKIFYEMTIKSTSSHSISEREKKTHTLDVKCLSYKGPLQPLDHMFANEVYTLYLPNVCIQNNKTKKWFS